jgi:hypothetical protein
MDRLFGMIKVVHRFYFPWQLLFTLTTSSIPPSLSASDSAGSGSMLAGAPSGDDFSFDYGSNGTKKPVHGRKRHALELARPGAVIIIIVLVAILLRARRVAANAKAGWQSQSE